jgi:hypothetical protein
VDKRWPGKVAHNDAWSVRQEIKKGQWVTLSTWRDRDRAMSTAASLRHNYPGHAVKITKVQVK